MDIVNESLPTFKDIEKILTRLENKTFYTALERYTSLIDKELGVFAKDILSAGAISKVVGKGKKDGNIHKGHWAMGNGRRQDDQQQKIFAKRIWV
jgi:hypothetical protein